MDEEYIDFEKLPEEVLLLKRQIKNLNLRIKELEKNAMEKEM